VAAELRNGSLANKEPVRRRGPYASGAAMKGKDLIKQLKRGKRGWSMTLPEEAGTCLGKRIDVSVRSSLPPRGGEPPLTKNEVALLKTILANLPKLAARAAKEWEDYGGYDTLNEEYRLSRPRIWIDREEQAGKSAGAWTMVVAFAGTSYGWHIEFVRTRFKRIWGGD
jgi:hypothetical protein